MDNQEQPTLIYTEDFIQSCIVFRLLPEEVLANFVRLLKVHSFAFITNDDTIDTVNKAFIAYMAPQKGASHIAEKHRYAHAKCRKMLDDRITDPDLEGEPKIRQLKAVVLYCIRYLSNRFNLTTTVQLPDKRQLKLTGNFVLICFMRGIDPHQYLQFFINQVSWARDCARNGSEESSNDPWMGFMSNMSADYFQDLPELDESDFFDQHEKLQALRETMKDEPDYEKRLAAFTTCLKEMYNSLRKVPINPCFLSEFID